MAGGGPALAKGTLGSLPNWGLSEVVFTIVALCSASSNKYLKMGSIAVAS